MYRILKKEFSEKTLSIEIVFANHLFAPRLRRADFMSYVLPSLPAISTDGDTNIPAIHICTRERPQSAGITAKGLLSDKIHGVDNTGNVCVWTTEAMLLYVLLTNIQLRDTLQGRRVLELGGGSTGLCGLGLSASKVCASVVITDGHPDCVANQRICRQICVQRGSIDPTSCPIESHLLKWQKDDPSQQLQPLIATEKFGIIIASDCLFFKDFHDDMIWVLQRALDEDGVCYLLQPRRGDTLDLFLHKASKYFSVKISEVYSEKVSIIYYITA
jgi:calmodulin-lysine N-methyltransferase